MLENRTVSVKSNGMLWLIAGLIIINAFWGASGVAVKEAYLQLNAVEIVTLRFVLATPLLLAATLLWKGRSALAIDLRDIPRFVFLATTGITLTFFLWVWALDYTTATNFTLISNLATFFIIFLSVAMIGEKLTKSKVIGAIVAFSGLGLIVTNGNFGLAPHFLGDALTLAGAFFWAVYTIVGKKLNEKYQALTVLNYVFLFASLELLPLYFLSPHTSPVEFTGLTWMSTGFLAICCTMIAFLVYQYGLERLSASTVAVFIYVMPLSGVALAALVLGEAVTAYTLLGAALVIYGMYKAEKKSGHRDIPAT